MLTKRTASALILLLSLLPGCSGKQTQPATGKVIDLSGIWDNPQEILLSSIGTDIEYIPLETTLECLLGEPQKLRATVLDRYIAISSKGLRLFDRKGKYLRTIGSIGKGPREYLNSGEYVISEKKNRVDILDADRFRVVSYQLTGEFIGSFDIRKRSEPDIIRDQSGRLGIFYLTPVEDEDNPTRIEWVSDSGELLKSISVYLGRPKGGGAFMSIMSNLNYSVNELIFNENPFDTIYHLKDDCLWEPYWIVDVGPRRMPPETSLDISRFSSELDRYNLAKFGAETSRYVFFTTHGFKGEGLAIYDKPDRKALYTTQELVQPMGLNFIPNDLDGGWPLLLSLLSGDDPADDLLACLLSPLDLITKFKNHPKSEFTLARPELREKLLKLVDRIHDDDNAVVMIVKLKTKNE